MASQNPLGAEEFSQTDKKPIATHLPEIFTIYLGRIFFWEDCE